LPESGPLTHGMDVDADALIERSRQLAVTPLGDRDRLASLLLGSSFLVVSIALAVLAHSSRQVGFLTLVVFVASYALASRIDFEIGTGSAVPTQLVLVPMLALLPVQYVPLCVAAALLLGGLPEYARGRVPVDRSLLRLVNSWHAVGPALVLIAAASPRRRRGTCPSTGWPCSPSSPSTSGARLYATVSASVSHPGASCASWCGSGPSTLP